MSIERLHLPDNIKVHFASLEGACKITPVIEMGVSYGLYSAYPYVYKKIFGKTKKATTSDLETTVLLQQNMRHIIQDSGLFSLLYGKAKHLVNKETIFKWYDALVEWTLEHGQDFTIVEVDCQDVLGTELAWDLRYRMRKDLPNHRIMNVFHLSDGVKGLDRLIEFSDYIGVGSGSPINSSATMYEVSSYIKARNPAIDIHLLGCTTLNTIKKCKFCTSCDSISYLSPLRFGWIGDYHISDLDSNKVKNMVGEEVWNTIRSYANEVNTNTYCATIEMHKRLYQKYCGNQDYTKNFQK